MNEPLSHAPDFPYEFQWVNADQPLSLFDGLQGYVILVHFWTSSSVNCQHVFSTLAFLEQRFVARSFIVVGVHTGKFHGERTVDHVLHAVRRFGVRHPVVIDEAGEIWKSYQCSAWPGFTLVDAGGHVRFQGTGEPDRDRMEKAIEFLLDEAASEGEEPYTQLTLHENDSPLSLDGLAYPTAVTVDTERDLLWIADTGRHRIVAVSRETSAVEMVVGSGHPGLADGALDACRFYEPGAMVIVADAVYVADGGNHMIRRIDLAERRVDTVLGTGRPVVDYDGGGSGDAQPINSPWGLAHRDGDLFIAMAGLHQIWRVDLATMTASPYAGTDMKGSFDGPRHDASLAQPAGLAFNGDKLGFVDSDTSSLRILDLERGEVVSLVEGGLYKWGDADGDEPMLQYPKGVAWHGDSLIVADTFNDKLRRWRDDVVDTFDVDVSRPEGLAVDGDTLFVADTHNHRILRVELAADLDGNVTHEVLELTGLPRGRTAFATDYAACKPIALPAMSEATLRLPMDLPAGAMLLPMTTPALDAENLEEHALLVDVSVTPDVEDGYFMARGIATSDACVGSIRVRLSYATCREENQVCHLHERRLEIPVTVEDGAPDRVDVVEC